MYEASFSFRFFNNQTNLQTATFHGVILTTLIVNAWKKCGILLVVCLLFRIFAITKSNYKDNE